MEKDLRIIILGTFIVLRHYVSFAQQVIQDSISTTTTITASSLPINNIVVTDSGNLRITSMTGVVIEGPFKVMLGGTLKIDIQEPTNIVFTYDNSGNRTARKFNE